MPTRHKAGSLKQRNKSHGGHGGHASKRSMKKAQGGKVNADPAGNVTSAPPRRGQGFTAGSKYQRLVQTKQARQQKKMRELLERRTGTRLGAPTIVLLLPMGPTADVASLASQLRAHADRVSSSIEGDTGAFVGVYNRHKRRLQVTGIPLGAGPLEVLDAAKTADVVVAVLSASSAGGGDPADSAVDENGLRATALLRAHGMPAVVGVCQHMKALHPKQASDFKRKATRFMAEEFGEHAKLVASSAAWSAPPPPPFHQPKEPVPAFGSSASLSGFGGVEAAAGSGGPGPARGGGVDVGSLVRAVSECPPRPLAWRESRAYLMATKVHVAPLNAPAAGAGVAAQPAGQDAPGGGGAGKGGGPVLAVSGYLRGAPLNVNQLVHVPGVGARRLLRIVQEQDPCPLGQPKPHPALSAGGSGAAAATAAGAAGGGGLGAAGLVLAESEESRGDPVEMVALPDGLTGEQTWPEAGEYGGRVHFGGERGCGGGDDDEEEDGPLERGVSEYQGAWRAAWLGDDGEGGDDDEEEEEGGGGGGQRRAAAMGDDDDERGGHRQYVVELGSSAGKAALRSLGAGNEGNGDDGDDGDDGQLSFLQSEGGGDGLRLDGLDEDMSPEQLLVEREAQRRQRAAEFLEFPDEVDAPVDEPARERFARYRSLASFRSSPWDPKESLPRDYSRLFDLGNFKATQRRVLDADARAAAKAEKFFAAGRLQLASAKTKNKNKTKAKGTAVAPEAGAEGQGLVAASRGGMQDDDDDDESARTSTSGATFTLPGAYDDDDEGDEEDEDDEGNSLSDDDEDDDESFAGGSSRGGGGDRGAGQRNRGLGKTPWVAPGTFVTLLVAAHPDGGDSSSSGGAPSGPTFVGDEAAFGVLASAHHGEGCAFSSWSPMSLHALHRHENRLTLLNCQVQRSQALFLDPEEAVASKEDMWVVCGFRRWLARPVFSQNNLNCDKNKFEMFLQGGPGNFLVASVYGPATFTPAPVLLLRQPPLSAAGGGLAVAGGALPLPHHQQQQPAASLANAVACAAWSPLPAPPQSLSLAASGVAPPLPAPLPSSTPALALTSLLGNDRALQLVAQGSLLSADVDRIVLKRIVLTGYPQRVHKRTAVIKHMFYRPDDVRWFKPAPLFSKHGLDGHILGPVGDHGLFKVHFGRAIQGHDTVCMYLYKRVYPKFVLPRLSGEGAENDGEANDDGRGALAFRAL